MEGSLTMMHRAVKPSVARPLNSTALAYLPSRLKLYTIKLYKTMTSRIHSQLRVRMCRYHKDKHRGEPMCSRG